MSLNKINKKMSTYLSVFFVFFSLSSLATFSFACSTSTTCNASTAAGDAASASGSSSSGSTGSTIICNIDYCDSEDINVYVADDDCATGAAGADINMGTASFSGNYEVELYTNPESDGECVYFRLTTTSNTTLNYQYTGLPEESFTVLPAGTSTGWCRYGGGSVNCPFSDDLLGSFSSSYSYDGISYDIYNTFSIYGTFDAETNGSAISVPIYFAWSMGSSIDGVGLSTTLSFPAAILNNFASGGTGSSANNSATCTTPPCDGVQTTNNESCSRLSQSDCSNNGSGYLYYMGVADGSTALQCEWNASENQCTPATMCVPTAPIVTPTCEGTQTPNNESCGSLSQTDCSDNGSGYSYYLATNTGYSQCEWSTSENTCLTATACTPPAVPPTPSCQGVEASSGCSDVSQSDCTDNGSGYSYYSSTKNGYSQCEWSSNANKCVAEEACVLS